MTARAWGCALGRDHVDDAVAAFLQRAEEGRQHAGGFRLGVVQQHDAAPDLVDTPHEALQFEVRRHLVPVAGPDVGAEHHDAAPLEPIEQRGAGGEAGEAEERRRRRAAGPAVERQFVGGDAAVDLGLRLGQRQVVEQTMRIGVMADRVALGAFAPRQRRMRRHVAAEQEEGGVHAFVLERVQHLRGRGRPGTVVEGQHQFLVVERQGLRELLAADPRRAGGVDRHRALGAERFGIAGQGCAAAHQGRERADRGGDERAKHRRTSGRGSSARLPAVRKLVAPFMR